MNFQAHLQGGLVAGSIAVGVALGTGYAEWQSDSLQRFLDQPLDFGQPISLLLSLFVTAVFMALFPDLDTTSVPQRWFFSSDVCNVGDSLLPEGAGGFLSARLCYAVTSDA